MTKFTAPKGTRDILPEEIYKWQYAERIFAQVCDTFGYREIRIPTFESTEVFQRGIGKTTDVVQKEMYTFLDKGNRSITLRPEGTAGVARCFVENGMSSMPAPVKLFYNITAFRYENVQKGRYREFHQLGLEAFGAFGAEIDAEIISLLAAYFKKIGLLSTKIKINSIGCPVCRESYNKKLKDYLSAHLDTMCATCKTRFETNPLRIIDCKEEKCKTVTKNAPALLDNLCEDCAAHFESLEKNLEILGISYEIDKNIVRGLDYYTKTVFEFVSENVGTQGTICGGGRYDGLIEESGGSNTPGIGFALGLERLLMEIDSQGISIEKPEPPVVYLASLGQAGADLSRKICLKLRDKGIRAETDLMNRSLKSQMKYAGKEGFQFVIVLGDDEINGGIVKLHDMRDGSDRMIAIEEIAEIDF
ncbi:MAG: histidine--tRNA ligase [Saccharofermentanales bacterium]